MALLAAVATVLTGGSLGLAPQPHAAAADTPTSVTVVGDLQDEAGCTADWQPDCAATTMTPGDGVYSLTTTVDAGTYEYKVAVGGTWDTNYGANGDLGGANITYTTDGGPVTFVYDPITHRVWNDAEAPIVTLPGSMQAALGCTQGADGGNWAPACLTTAMYPNGDGTWTYSTSDLPEGTYEVKVAHNMSWDENYGVDGAADGANYSFAVQEGKRVTFTYTMSTHVLDVAVAAPQVVGLEEQRAYWVDATTLAWPVSLIPTGMGREDLVDDSGRPVAGTGLELSLVTAPQGGAGVTDGSVVTGPGGREIPLRITGDLPDGVLAAHPNLAGYVALSLTDAEGTALLDDTAVRTALTGQLAVVQRLDASGDGGGVPDGGAQGDTAPSGTVDAFTGIQTAPLLDVLYAGDARKADLGVSFTDGSPRFALWAPTAKSVTLLSWDTGSVVGSAAQVDGDAVRTPALRGDDGRWTVANTGGAGGDGAIRAGSQYLWEVEVYVPSTGKVERNLVTDPYSVALTTDSTRSVAVDLSDPSLAPEQWATTASPTVLNDAARTIYELHVRDFSAADATVPLELRGTYEAFTVSGSDGMTHLAELADAGVDTIHLLPTFDIATIPEDRANQVTAPVPDAGPASPEQQAAVASTAATDAYNWGYDPYHWMSPEGSYATDGNQDGGVRTVQFRDMVGALHATGLQVVLDEVYNHTAASGQEATSVLDRVVPGYYQRLDAVGKVTNSTCCSNVATENAMSEQLMIDSVVWWAKEYKVDGFRFDLMGHHSRSTMEAVRAALDQLTLADDGVDGSAIYLYGEGWNFGEVADNALFTQATQGQLDGTGIGTFNDRLRDAVHGGGPFDSDHRTYQGFGSGEVTDPNGYDDRSEADQAADLAHRTDLVRLGLAGNLKDYSFTTADGTVSAGRDIDYNGSPAGYASSPQENVNYVDAHDNETLFDLLVYKLPEDTPMADRIRMNTLSLATVALGQSPSFWAAGTEILRSKSLDRDSYDSGDHTNAIDWSMQANGFGTGLPVESKNGSAWPVMVPLLENPGLVPGAADIAASNAQALDLLRVRASTPLFSLGDAGLIQDKLSFPGSGPDATPGVITMLVDDTAGGGGAEPASVDDGAAQVSVQGGGWVDGASGAGGPQARSAVLRAGSGTVLTAAGAASAVTDVDPSLDGVLVVFNASAQTTTQTISALAGREFTLSTIQAEGSDQVVKTTTFDVATGTVTVPARTVAVLTEAQGTVVAPTEQPTAEPSGQATEQPTGSATAPGQSTGSVDASPSGASSSGASGGALAVTGVRQGLALLVLALLAGGGVLLRLRRRSAS